MAEYESHEIPGPIEEPQGRRWLAYIPPPIGEWFYTGSVSGPPSWTLHCPPMFLAHISRERTGLDARFRATLNRKDLGEFWILDAAKRRLELEIVTFYRAALGTVAMIRRHLRNSPNVRDVPPPEVQRRIARSFKPPPDPADQWKCKCGFTYRDRQVWQVWGSYGRCAFYCADCIPADVKKEMVDPLPERRPEQRYFQPGILCACGEQATYLREGKPICDKCYDPRTKKE